MRQRQKYSSSREAGTVVGLFHSQPQAERAIRSLQDAGFRDDQIGILMQDPERQQQLADDTGTKAGGAAATGAISGGMVGGVLGLLAGVGALAIPGIGPIIAGGTFASTLAGAGIGAAAGGLLGALVGMGIPEEEARYYERGVQEGGILLTVEAGRRSEEARNILTDAEAQLAPGVETGSESVPHEVATGEERQRLELREEELRASKERVQTGEVRIRKTPVVKEEVVVAKRQIQETQQVQDTVRREEARIEERTDARSRDRGPTETESWRGNERRYGSDRTYAGPERRVANV